MVTETLSDLRAIFLITNFLKALKALGGCWYMAGSQLSAEACVAHGHVGSAGRWETGNG
jgi:hypothetical protein